MIKEDILAAYRRKCLPYRKDLRSKSLSKATPYEGVSPYKKGVLSDACFFYFILI